MTGGKVADVQADLGEPRYLRDLALRQEAIRDSALVEDLDGSGMQTTGSRAGQILAGSTFDNGNVDACQCQLARQHQPGRTSPGNDHRMAGHRFDIHLVTPVSLSFGFAQRFCGIPRVLPQAPGCAIN
jgi:hypothetical protein